MKNFFKWLFGWNEPVEYDIGTDSAKSDEQVDHPMAGPGPGPQYSDAWALANGLTSPPLNEVKCGDPSCPLCYRPVYARANDPDQEAVDQINKPIEFGPVAGDDHPEIWALVTPQVATAWCFEAQRKADAAMLAGEAPPSPKKSPKTKKPKKSAKKTVRRRAPKA